MVAEIKKSGAKVFFFSEECVILGIGVISAAIAQ